MANHISPVAQLFRSMADLVDHDHTSQTHYEAVTRAAEALAARASTQQLVAGPLWQADGTSLLAAAYAFHAGLPRQAATATHVRALVETSPAPSNGGEQTTQGDPIPGMAGDAVGRTARSVPTASIEAAQVDPKRLPGPPLHQLDPADEAKLWTALSELRRGQVVPRGQLIRLTGWLPTDLAVHLLALLERGAGAGWGGGGSPPRGDRPQRPDHPGPGGGDPGLVGSRRAGSQRRQHRPGPPGPAQRRRPLRLSFAFKPMV